MKKALQIARSYVISSIALLSTAVHADDHRDLFLSFNSYPVQTRVSDDTDFTLNSGARITDKISYYGFVNLRNTFKSDDIAMVVSEQKLRWNLTEIFPIDIEGEYKIRAGEDNDVFQTGVRLRVDDSEFLKPIFDKLNIIYALTAFMHTTNNQGINLYQMSHVYQITFPYINDRIYLSGFVDHSFNQAVPDGVPNSPVISETQLGYRLYNNLYSIVEYRVNQYRRSNVTNIAVGLELKTTW